VQTQLKIASEERQFQAKLAWEREKYIMDLQAKAGKLTFDAIESKKDRELEATLEANKAMLELEKEREATRQSAMDIAVPLFMNRPLENMHKKP
jgi:hypothetical protein